VRLVETARFAPVCARPPGKDFRKQLQRAVPHFSSSSVFLDETAFYPIIQQRGRMQHLNAEGAQDSPGNTLYLRYASTIFTYLSQQVANLQDAEDLLLEVFIAAFKYKMLADLPAESQLAWLRRVARNKVIDRYRHTALLALLPLEQAASYSQLKQRS
jgi:sigma-70-like protein